MPPPHGPSLPASDQLTYGGHAPVGESQPTRARIVSLDQFRGYTVAGMILVNFLGDYPFVPDVLKHHDTYFSYADTIMPAFHFAVGFALRLTLLKRIATVGGGPARRQV